MATVRTGKHLIQDIIQTLKTEGEARLSGLGSFRVKGYPPRKWRHPNTGKLQRRPAVQRVVFKVSPLLDKAVNGGK